MMDDYSRCPIRNVVSTFTDEWSMKVLYTLGKEGSMSFATLSSTLYDASEDDLSVALSNLKQHHLVAIGETIALTALGQSLMPSLNGVVSWARENEGHVTSRILVPCLP